MRDRTSPRELRAHRRALRGLSVRLDGGGPGGRAHADAGGYVASKPDCYQLPAEWLTAFLWVKTLPGWERLWWKLTDYLRRRTK